MSELGRSEDTPQVAAVPRTLSDATRRIILLAFMGYLMMLAPLTWFQRSLIYQPRPCERLLARQSGLPQVTIDVAVKSDDGLELHGWLALAGVSSSSDSVDVQQALSNDRPVVFYFPGNAGNRSLRYAQMTVMGTLNAHTLLVDYRGYADNPGKPTEENFARDARSAWNYATIDLGISPRRIVIYGESLGGGVATRLASELCQEGIEPGGLIVQSTFDSLVAVAQTHFPILPVSLVLVDRYPSDVRIASATCPILQIHGEKDSIVPFKCGQKLFDAAKPNSSSGVAKRQLVMPNTDHNDVYSDGYGGDSKLVAELKSFLDNVADAGKVPQLPPKSLRAPTELPPRRRAWAEIIDGAVVATILILLLVCLACWLFRRSPSNNS